MFDKPVIQVYNFLKGGKGTIFFKAGDENTSSSFLHITFPVLE